MLPPLPLHLANCSPTPCVLAKDTMPLTIVSPRGSSSRYDRSPSGMDVSARKSDIRNATARNAITTPEKMLPTMGMAIVSAVANVLLSCRTYTQIQ